MTKKDFELIAQVVNLLDVAFGTRLMIARDFRDVLKRENPRFKPTVFMEAAGFKRYCHDW